MTKKSRAQQDAASVFQFIPSGSDLPVSGLHQMPAAITCWKKPRAAALQNGGTSEPW